ncbi:MAG: phosphatidylglycerol lysyltransferase domain-containing protein, partial [Roseimicrobium sp.]
TGCKRAVLIEMLSQSTLSGLSTHPLAPLWSKIAARVGSFYNFQGLRDYKSKFSPRREPRYIAAQQLELPTALLDATALIGGLHGALAKDKS